MADTMDIEILPDGTIKVTTGRISMANHMTAEALLRNLAQAAGGAQDRKHRHGTIAGRLHDLAHAKGEAH